jgi:hypothetical protein
LKGSPSTATKKAAQELGGDERHLPLLVDDVGSQEISVT